MTLVRATALLLAQPLIDTSVPVCSVDVAHICILALKQRLQVRKYTGVAQIVARVCACMHPEETQSSVYPVLNHQPCFTLSDDPQHCCAIQLHV